MEAKRSKFQDTGFLSDSDEDKPDPTVPPLSVSWLQVGAVNGTSPKAQLGITELPGGKTRNLRRNLEDDMKELKKLGVSHAIVLNTDSELRRLRVTRLFIAYHGAGIAVHRIPIEDGDVPTEMQARQLLDADLDSILADDNRVVIHCWGGLGRAGTVVAAMLMERNGDSADDVIELMRSLRGPGAIQTVKQYNMLHTIEEARTKME